MILVTCTGSTGALNGPLAPAAYRRAAGPANCVSRSSDGTTRVGTHPRSVRLPPPSVGIIAFNHISHEGAEYPVSPCKIAIDGFPSVTRLQLDLPQRTTE